MKSRRWIAAAALAAAVVFLVMITGQHGPATPGAASAQVSQSGAVLSSDGGPPQGSGDDGGNNDGANRGDGAGAGEAADREEVIDALQGLLDALGVSADELADGAAGCNGDQEGSGAGNDAGRSGEKAQEKDESCGQSGQSGQSSADRSADATITIAGFAFGQPQTVEPGATVEVVNTDAAPHNVTASDKSFETPDLNQDETATFTAPSTPGRYEFTCTLHPEMTGTLIVEGARSEQNRSRSSEPGSGRAGTDNEGSQQHSTTAPDRTRTGTDGGY